VWCPLKVDEVKEHVFIFIGLRCLEILHLFLPPACPPPPKSLSALFAWSTTLSYLIPPLYFLSLFLFYCLALDLSTIFAVAPPSLVLAEAAAAAVFARAPLPLVLTAGRCLAGLLGSRRMCCLSCGQARYIDWVLTTLFVLAELSLWPCVPLQH